MTANNTLCVIDERHRRADVRHRRRHRHRDRQHVIHQQRAGHRQPRGGAEVGGDHLVVAAARRVGVHVLPVAGDHDEHHRARRPVRSTAPSNRRSVRPPTAPGRFPPARRPPTTARRRRTPAGRSAWATACATACRCGTACRDTNRRATVESLDTRAKSKPSGRMAVAFRVRRFDRQLFLSSGRKGPSGACSGDGMRPGRRVAVGQPGPDRP